MSTQLGLRGTKARLGPQSGTAIRSAVSGLNVEPFVEQLHVLVDAEGCPAQLRRLVIELAMRGRLQTSLAGDDSVDSLVQRLAADVGERGAKYEPVTDEEMPFSVPRNWRWVRWGHLARGTSSGWSPQCDGRPRAEREWGVLKVSAVSWGAFAPDENKALPESVEPRPEFSVRDGDFLMSRANTAELVGRSVIVAAAPA